MITDQLHLTHTKKILTGENKRVSNRGLRSMCMKCGKPIRKYPFFSKGTGRSGHTHYYHLGCARKVGFHITYMKKTGLL